MGQTGSSGSNVESFKPIPVSSPKDNPLLFFVRCLVDLQLKTIVDFLRPALRNVSNNIVDIGAGNAPWRGFLPNGVQYVGLDIENAAEFHMQKNEAVVYYQGGIFPFEDASFFNALCVEVLEHVPDTEMFLGEIFRCLKPEGRLILTVPWSARRHHLPHDYFRFTPEALDRLLKDRGFVDVKISERGNDFSVVFNKTLCLVRDMFFPDRKRALFLTIPVGLLLLPSCVLFLLAAHLSLLFGVGSKIDPLGYAVTARKPQATLS
jgi:SAM-dependent methyltransferase